jgi:acetyl-CoA C-acetyltransferase
MGKLFEHFSKIAAENPYSWTKKSFGFKEIIDLNNDNRLITHPYTKRMCANLYVDQSASILITSEKFAQNINLNRELWVNIIGGSDLNNIHEITQRPRLYDSPAVREAAKLALNQAGLTLDQIDGFDIYSCFPSIVQIIMDELGITLDNKRNLTLTGGLPYFGGPWSNYSLHSIVNAVNLIRNKPSLKIMVIANGGYNTKQSIGIYGKFGPKISWDELKSIEMAVQKKIDSAKLMKPIEKANGKIIIRGYTITYDRSGKPEKGIILGEFKNGTRTLALMNFSIKRLLKLENEELVGKKAKIAYNKEINRNVVISLEE